MNYDTYVVGYSKLRNQCKIVGYDEDVIFNYVEAMGTIDFLPYALTYSLSRAIELADRIRKEKGAFIILGEVFKD